MFMFVHDEVEEGYVTLEDDLQDTLDDGYDAMFAKEDELIVESLGVDEPVALSAGEKAEELAECWQLARPKIYVSIYS